MNYILEMPAVVDSLRVASPFTDAVLGELPQMPERSRLIHDLALVASEALTNAIRHCGNSSKPVKLGFQIDSGKVAISVTDYGSGFDPDTVSLPDFDGYPEGGFGIYIMKNLMDQIRYEKSEDGNTMILTKLLEIS